MDKIKSWLSTRKRLIKRDIVLKHIEGVVRDYKETNIYDKYMRILTIITNEEE